MNYDEFFDSISQKDIRIDIKNIERQESVGLNNEALFQLPLIAMIILLISKNRVKPRVNEVGGLVGKLLEDVMLGFKGSSQLLGWSANLRIRTVTALNFLESVCLIIIDERNNKLNITKLGKKVIDEVFIYESDLSYNLALIDRAYRNYCVDSKLDGEIL
ncbi:MULTISPECIES: hypothetical protein [Enterobacterales]|jgi:hypothetical protein|uniref:Uncharacterized protein n=2 Tax=Enterobacterales TaxID=91347 RepID=A0A1V2R849_9GAMM|nr:MULTISPECIES: hypothetical protein [Enterobacterales]EMA4455587.1 hypothetical protein [Citrobacter freundii]HDL8324630.1 hypothetical protein [Yersinia enterocolitica]AKK84144.1 hypothetical protein ABY61_23760 [Klebsiella aerogenes]EKV0504955.1 hypothetical protein [Raoultella ornithinolytica]EKW7679636.1 hypothetical protein [Raoultella ornithinolytica]